ncbi:HAD family hydrolase [Sphingomonas jeddahensis]|uniref:Uncharacterized protein n=1 Tax=Sphingomonas jeddahensis TaxID=1915074 RepID=A0A1V2EXM0_9SPHN|nr:hypothetical protein [Sphingomonas jeddahensis]ONF97421.1 hypothetical protein SPHI_00500 [Sphingomonas jeddahensis]
MHAVRIFHSPSDVANRLSQFGIVAEDVNPLIEAVVAARNDVVSADARTAAGTKAYLAGVRHLRFLFLPKGWQSDSTNGVESVVHVETGMRIVYQSVESACVAIRGPQPINAKGPAAENAIKMGQGVLFRDEELPEVAPEKIADLNSMLWFLCVSVNDEDEEDVRAELSLPAAIESGQFKGFLERIFIVKGGDWKARSPVMTPEDDGAYEFSIARK